MNDELIIQSIKAKCRKDAALGHTTLWMSKDFYEDTHLAKLTSLARLFDLAIGCTAHIEGHVWRLQERKRDDGEPGILVELVRVDLPAPTPPPPADCFGMQDGMVTENRPRTPKEWKMWAVARAEAKGIPLRPADPPKSSRPEYTVSMEGALEAEGLK